MTPAEKKASELANSFEPFNYGNSEEEQRDAFIAGFRAALELDEVKGMENTLERYSHLNMLDETNEYQPFAEQALTAWRSFRGGEVNHHHLKIWPEHYNNVKAGSKTFEIRKNDRGFQKGDKVRLYEYCPEEKKYKDSSRLDFYIGDVYPIDSERVVFSLLPIKS